MPRKPSGAGGAVVTIPTPGSSIPTEIHRADLRRQVSRGRTYIWPPGDNPTIYQSVTSILQAVPKPALMYWSARTVAEAAVESYDLLGQLIAKDSDKAVTWLKESPWTDRDRAARFGTLMHELVELWLAEDHVAADLLTAKLDAEARKKARQLRNFVDTIPIEWHTIEGVVYNNQYHYAGTVDLIGRIADEQLLERFGLARPVQALFDVKTGKGVYPETALQLCAYANADKLLDNKSGVLTSMPRIDITAVIHITPSSWALIPVVSDEVVFEKFIDVLNIYQHLPLDDGLIGNPVLRGGIV